MSDDTADARAARDEIRQLQARYNVAGDRGEAAKLSEVFAADGIIHFDGETTQGPAAIEARLGAGDFNPALTVTRHHLTTSLIEIDDDAARGRTYFAVHTNIGLDHHGVYVDRYRRIDGAWRIAHREVRIDWQAENSLYRPLRVRGRTAPSAS